MFSSYRFKIKYRNIFSYQEKKRKRKDRAAEYKRYRFIIYLK
jgi:hypothetical protein